MSRISHSAYLISSDSVFLRIRGENDEDKQEGEQEDEEEGEEEGGGEVEEGAALTWLADA